MAFATAFICLVPLGSQEHDSAPTKIILHCPLLPPNAFRKCRSYRCVAFLNNSSHIPCASKLLLIPQINQFFFVFFGVQTNRTACLTDKKRFTSIQFVVLAYFSTKFNGQFHCCFQPFILFFSFQHQRKFYGGLKFVYSFVLTCFSEISARSLVSHFFPKMEGPICQCAKFSSHNILYSHVSFLLLGACLLCGYLISALFDFFFSLFLSLSFFELQQQQ